MELSLRKVGFQVTTSGDGRDAFDKATLLTPDLVLSEVELPGLDGVALLSALRGKPRTASLPVVFLTEDASVGRRVEALAAGAVDYLSKPIYIKEVVARIRILLQKHEGQRQADAPTPEMTGSLADKGLVELLRSLETQTGAILCVGAQDETASLWIRNGRVEDVELGQLTGEAAFYRLLRWPEGRWQFNQGEHERPARITSSTEQLLGEGLKRVDEWTRQLATLSGLDAVYEVDFVALASRLGEVADENNAVLQLLDGRRTLRQVVEGSPFEDAETLTVVNKLVRERLIRLAGGTPTGLQTNKLAPSVVSQATGSTRIGELDASERAPAEEPSPSPLQAEVGLVATLPVEEENRGGDAEPERSDAQNDLALDAAIAVSLDEGDEASAWAGGGEEGEPVGAVPLSDIELDAILAGEGLGAHEEDTKDIIKVMRYPARLGSRRKRLEEEARRALADAAKTGEPLLTPSNEALTPGARAKETQEQRVAAYVASEPVAKAQPPSLDPSEAVTLPAIAAFEPDSSIDSASDKGSSETDDEDFSHIVKKGRAGPIVAVGLLVVLGIVFFILGKEKPSTTEEASRAQMAQVAVEPVETPVTEPKPANEAAIEAAEAVSEPAEEVEEPVPAAESGEISEPSSSEKDNEPAESAAAVPAAPAAAVKSTPARTPAPVANRKNELPQLASELTAAAAAENWSKVRSTAQRILSLEANHPVALRELGKAQYHGDELKEARSTLLRATRAAAADAEAFMFLGIVHQEMDNRDEAKKAYRRFLQLEPKASSRYKDIAAVLENMER